MPTILLTNDDGIDSPTLAPLAHMIQRFGPVRVVVPDTERSWIAKAITRFDLIRVEAAERGGLPMHAVAGTPADCVNLGVYNLYRERPALVVSGINLGLNFGSAFLLGSGTIGAALEAWIAGIPAIAFSMAIPNDAYGLTGPRRIAALAHRPAAAAEVAADIVAQLLQVGFPESVDCFSVNMPADVTMDTPRVIARVTRSRYADLFTPDAVDGYRHQFKGLTVLESLEDGDIQVVNRGAIAITPLHLDFFAPLPEAVHAALEGRRAGSGGRGSL